MRKKTPEGKDSLSNMKLTIPLSNDLFNGFVKFPFIFS